MSAMSLLISACGAVLLPNLPFAIMQVGDSYLALYLLVFLAFLSRAILGKICVELNYRFYKICNSLMYRGWQVQLS